MQPGMKFKGDYVVAAWSDLQALRLDAKVLVHVVREILVPETVRFPIADAERAQGIRLPLSAEQQQQPAGDGAEAAGQPLTTGEASEPAGTTGLTFHPIRKYAGSLRAKYAPYLTSSEWIALGQKGRKDLVDDVINFVRQ